MNPAQSRRERLERWEAGADLGALHRELSRVEAAIGRGVRFAGNRYPRELSAAIARVERRGGVVRP